MSSVKPRREASPLPLKLFRMQWSESTKPAKQNNKELANPILPIPHLILAFFLIGTVGHHQTTTGSIPSICPVFGAIQPTREIMIQPLPYCGRIKFKKICLSFLKKASIRLTRAIPLLTSEPNAYSRRVPTENVRKLIL